MHREGGKRESKGKSFESMGGTCFLDQLFLELWRFEDVSVVNSVFVDCGVGRGLILLAAMIKNLLFSDHSILSIGLDMVSAKTVDAKKHGTGCPATSRHGHGDGCEVLQQRLSEKASGVVGMA